MNRRNFLRGAGAAAISCTAPAPHFLVAQDRAQPIAAKLTIKEDEKLGTVPEDFIGLSYESAQLANPAFFAAENTALVALFRELTDRGVLRLGGGTSEFTVFTTEEVSSPPPFDAVGPDTSRNVKSDTLITLKSLRNLRAFLDAANWSCLYGLNLGRGTAAHASEEAFYAQSILGLRLIAFQLGNEPDAWRNRYRPSTWSYADYWKEWTAASKAILERVPEAKFAGPDISNKMDYVTGFASNVKGDRHVVMLTWHYYAMGPAGAEGITMGKLLAPDPKLDRDLKIAMDAAREAGLPYRMSEGNSCWNGGQPGVSDTLGSALWATDTLLHFASAGCAGVNLHGGGEGYYTPIAGSLGAGFVRRPEFFGIKLAKEFVGATLLQSSLACESDGVHAYAGRKNDDLILAAINKTERFVTIKTAFPRASRQWELTGPAIDAKQDIRIEESGTHTLHGGVVSLKPYSAVVVAA
jgi:hypothetical protein